jgi:5-(carboxyamino)imidazole ribonucleotide synthase
VPARGSACLRDNAAEYAERIAEKLGYIGTLGVEFFVSRGQLYVNEMAPRPHNSGHYTVDACVTSQYEQQVRALCGLPLGDARAHSAAVMVNILGDLWYDRDHYREPDWSKLAAIPNLKVHFYGKHHARHGRKMAHFTVLDSDFDRAVKIAMEARAVIGIVDEPSPQTPSPGRG